MFGVRRCRREMKATVGALHTQLRTSTRSASAHPCARSRVLIGARVGASNAETLLRPFAPRRSRRPGRPRCAARGRTDHAYRTSTGAKVPERHRTASLHARVRAPQNAFADCQRRSAAKAGVPEAAPCIARGLRGSALLPWRGTSFRGSRVRHQHVRVLTPTFPR
jgi:hypothetical protein